MAQDTTITSGYAGALAGEIFILAFKKGDTINKGAITVLPNNIGSGYLPTLTYDADLQPYACGFTPEGDIVYNDKKVILNKFKIDHEFCKDEFHQTFQAHKAGLFGAANEIPQKIEDALLLSVIDNLGAKVEDYIWAGLSGSYAGLEAELVADTDVIGITASTIDATNVVAELTKVYNAIPDAILESTDLRIAVAPGVARAYKQAQVAMGINTTVGDKELDYLGIELVSLSGLSANTMVAYRKKNLAFLTGLESDLNNVRVKDMDEFDLSGNLRTQVVLEIGVGYSFGQEIVLYHDDIA